MMIKTREIEFDENNKIKAKQESCAACTKREFCNDLKEYIGSLYFPNDWEKMLFLLKLVCENYQSVYIQYPIEVSAIESDNGFALYKNSELVIAEVYIPEHDGETCLALYLGDMPNTIVTTYNKETKIVKNKFLTIPMLYIFRLNKIIPGTRAKWQDLYESGIKTLTEEEQKIVEVFQKIIKTDNNS